MRWTSLVRLGMLAWWLGSVAATLMTAGHHRVLVGHEVHPTVDCVLAAVYTLWFVVPATGVNSEGAWDYTDGLAPLEVELRAGAM